MGLGVMMNYLQWCDHTLHFNSSTVPRCVFVLDPKWDWYANEQVREGPFTFCIADLVAKVVTARAGSLLQALLSFLLPTNYG